MNQSQRVVLVIALGVGALIAVVTANVVLYEPIAPGWFDYAPNTGVTASDSYFIVVSDWLIVRQSLAGLMGVATWTAAAMWLLRTRTEVTEG
jgi:hypothetical protein